MSNKPSIADISRSVLKHSGIADRVITEEKPTHYDDPVLWIRDNFYIPETHGPMPLQWYQRLVLSEAYRRDVDGNFVYSTIVWSDIKKSAKSSIAAAVCIERAFHTPFGSVKIIANDLKQADSRVAYYARRAIELNPTLKSQVRQKLYKTTFPNHATIEAIPIDPSGEAGGNDDFICYSELWGANSKAATRMWTELTLSPTKYGQSQRWIETYAGFSGESELLEQLYDNGVKHGRQLDLMDGLEVYANDASRQLTLWNTVPRCPWQSPAYYSQEQAVLTPEEFDRVHRNQWSSAQAAFVPIEWWQAAQVAELPKLDKYREVIVALDAAVSDDCFAITALSRHGDNLATQHIKVYYPPRGGKILYSNPDSAHPEDRDYPEGEIRWLAANYNVIAFTYDPYQLHHLCSTLRNESLGYFLEFPQGTQRLESDKQLYDLIKARRILHTGDKELHEHIKNANRDSANDGKLRIVKRSQTLKIDLAVALSMASFHALRLLSE